MQNPSQPSDENSEANIRRWTYIFSAVAVFAFVFAIFCLFTERTTEFVISSIVVIAFTLFTWLGFTNANAAKKDKALQKTNRERLLEKVYTFWIEGVLDKALHDNVFEIGMELAPKAVLKPIDREEIALPSTADILKVMDEVGRALLILGAPGAGKTVLLLQVAEKLIERAEQDATKPIPIVLNLSSWAEKKSTLQDWLIERLFLEYQVPRKVGKHWIENEALLPLLDGLDEVKEDVRSKCVDFINAFRQQYKSVNPVVCSRYADYELLTSRLNLQNAIVVQPLTDDDVEKHLASAEFVALRETMRHEPYTKEMARTPFLLNTMTRTYQGLSLAELSRFDTRQERLDHLLYHYFKLRFTQLAQDQYTLAQTRHWLSWLADKMVKSKQSVFYVESLQPQWLTHKRHRLYVRLTIGLVVGPLFGLLFGLVGILLFGLLLGVVVGLLFGLAEKIEAAETIVWSWSRQNMAVGLPLGVIGGLGAWLLFGQMFGQMFALLVVMMGVSAFGLNTRETLAARVKPNQGIRHSAYNALKIGVMFGLLGGVMFGLLGGLLVGLLGGLAVGSEFGILFGGGSVVIKHLSLRILLWRLNFAPLNYARFLDYCASIGIMRKVGGGYIFQHRMLLEYFASLYDENKSPTS